MSSTSTITALHSGVRPFVVACVVFAAPALSERRAHVQVRDGLLNGTVIGAAVGAGVGVAFAHAVRDSDLNFGQYARGALVFGAIGARVGLGVDALFSRASPGPGVTPRPLLIAPAVWRDVAGGCRGVEVVSALLALEQGRVEARGTGVEIIASSG